MIATESTSLATAVRADFLLCKTGVSDAGAEWHIDW